MVSLQHRIERSSMIITIGLICVCVVMQMLGTTMTLWDLTYQLDPVNATLLEGYSLPASLISFQPDTIVWSTADASHRLHPILREQSLLRPPNRLV